jgi:hypothetical protein
MLSVVMLVVVMLNVVAHFSEVLIDNKKKPNLKFRVENTMENFNYYNCHYNFKIKLYSI